MAPDKTGKDQDRSQEKNSKTIGKNLGANRFQKGQSGNPRGRPKGSLNKTTLAVQSILNGEAESITRMAIQYALEGDTTALKLCLERIIPVKKDSPVNFRLPAIKSADDIVRVQTAIIREVSKGEITPMEAMRISTILEGLRKTFELQELENRISNLEEKNINDQQY
jgi:hypothetical protein